MTYATRILTAARAGARGFACLAACGAVASAAAAGASRWEQLASASMSSQRLPPQAHTRRCHCTVRVPASCGARHSLRSHLAGSAALMAHGCSAMPHTAAAPRLQAQRRHGCCGRRAAPGGRCGRGRCAAVSALLAAPGGIDVNAPAASGPHAGTTALRAAYDGGHGDVMRLLMAAGADARAVMTAGSVVAAMRAQARQRGRCPHRGGHRHGGLAGRGWRHSAARCRICGCPRRHARHAGARSPAAAVASRVWLPADEDGCTPLHCASAAPECLRVLLDAGADVHARDDGGATPLMRAAGDAAWAAMACGCCLHAGADVNARDDRRLDGGAPRCGSAAAWTPSTSWR